MSYVIVFVVGIGVGCVIGWNTERPNWVANVQNQVVDYLNSSNK